MIDAAAAEVVLLLIERFPKEDIKGAVVRDDVCIMSAAAADATRRVINAILDDIVAAA